MIGPLFIGLALSLSATLAIDSTQRIEGLVVNQTQGGIPVAGAEVILRAGQDGALALVARTVSDSTGHFTFTDLPVEPGVSYLPGANHQGIHYPGSRIPATAGFARAILSVSDTSTSPDPLIAERHELDVLAKTGVMEITETLVINNPTTATYVGTPGADGPPTTLSLAIPSGFERITFTSEFHGRHFKVADNHLVTDLPWTPGKRELKFTYALPVESSHQLFERTLDLPTRSLTLRVHGAVSGQVVSNLPSVADGKDGTFVFHAANEMLPAGHRLTLELGKMPTPWIVHARWAALGVLAVLIVGTTILVKRRRTSPALGAPLVRARNPSPITLRRKKHARVR